ncbi:MAG TPA: hypothetical protein VF371_08085 [Candidatus Limnocylindrales bacterium]
MRMFMVLVLAASVAGRCSALEEETVYLLPSVAISIELPTQAGTSSTACPPTDLAPVKADWDATHRALSVGGEKVVWPSGFSARELPSGHLEILSPDGTVVARDGDTIRLGGSDYMHVCRVQSVEY